MHGSGLGSGCRHTRAPMNDSDLSVCLVVRLDRCFLVVLCVILVAVVDPSCHQTRAEKSGLDFADCLLVRLETPLPASLYANPVDHHVHFGGAVDDLDWSGHYCCCAVETVGCSGCCCRASTHRRSDEHYFSESSRVRWTRTDHHRVGCSDCPPETPYFRMDDH